MTDDGDRTRDVCGPDGRLRWLTLLGGAVAAFVASFVYADSFGSYAAIAGVLIGSIMVYALQEYRSSR